MRYIKFNKKSKIKLCEQQCLDKFTPIFNENKSNDYYNFQDLHNNIKSCSNNCEEIYRRVISHQEKSSEISYVIIFKDS